jgi:hypothetical protein
VPGTAYTWVDMNIFSILDGKYVGKVSKSIHAEHSPVLSEAMHSTAAALNESHNFIDISEFIVVYGSFVAFKIGLKSKGILCCFVEICEHRPESESTV